MLQVTQWVNVAWLLLILLVWTFLPGRILVAAITPGRHPLIAWAQAPAWTFFILLIASNLTPNLFRWTLATSTLSVVIICLLAWLGRLGYQTLTRHPRFSRLPQPYLKAERIPLRSDSIASNLKHRLLHISATVLVAIIVTTPFVLNIGPHEVVQGGDSNYHYNQLWLMLRSGDASMFTANATMAGLTDTGWYYPNTWHVLLTPVASLSSVIVATNLTMLLGTIIWLVGAGALTAVIISGRNAYLYGLIASSFAPIALIRLQFETTLWPFVLGMAALPGILAAIIDRLTPRQVTLSDRHCVAAALRAAIWSAPGIIGVMAMHISTVVAPGFAAFLIIFITLLRRSIALWRSGNRPSAVRHAAGALTLLYAVIVIVNGPGPQSFQFRRYPRVDFSQPAIKLFVSSTMYTPNGTLLLGVITHGLIGALLLWGIVLAWKRRQRTLIWAWGAQWLLVVASYFPLYALSRVTSLYYNSPLRAQVAAALFAVPLIALSLRSIFKAGRKLLPASPALSLATGTLIVILMTTLTSPGLKDALTGAYHPQRGDTRFLADLEELAMLKRIGTEIPPNSYVLGDPATGTSLLQVLSNIRVVYPYPSTPTDPEGEYLNKLFFTLPDNPEVCEIINRHHITHVYLDQQGYFNGGSLVIMRPGYYSVDTTRGLELVDQAGGAALYRITGCEPGKAPTGPSVPLVADQTCESSGETTACLY